MTLEIKQRTGAEKKNYQKNIEGSNYRKEREKFKETNKRYKNYVLRKKY